MNEEFNAGPIRQGWLDGIRGLAALWVLLAHATYAGLLPPILNFRGSGRGGVVLFFFLSAYLLSGPFVRKPQRARAWRSWVAYAIRRVLRIAPLYYTVILLFFALRLEPFDTSLHTLPRLGQHLAFQKGDSVFWTIVIEMRFYCLLPIFLIIFSPIYRTKCGRSVLLLAGSLWILGLATRTMPPGFFSTLCIDKHAPVFVAGVLTAIALSGRRPDLPSGGRPIVWECVAWCAGTAYVCLAIPGLYYALTRGDSLATYSASSPIYEQFWNLRIPWIGLVLGGFFFSLANGTGVIRRALAIAPLAWLGRVSFGVYLVHAVVLTSIATQHPVPKPVEFVLALIATLGLAWLGHLAIEAPMIAVGKRITATLVKPRPSSQPRFRTVGD